MYPFAIPVNETAEDFLRDFLWVLRFAMLGVIQGGRLNPLPFP